MTKTLFDWRKHLKVHAAADLFPLMSKTELKELAADIKRNGLQHPVVIRQQDSDGEDEVIDGRNRLDALAQLGRLGPKRERTSRKRKSTYAHEMPLTLHGYATEELGYDRLFDRVTLDDDVVHRYIVSANIQRRHLTSEQKRELIAKLLKQQPETSDRQIGKTVKTDHKTVAVVRSDMEGRGEIPHVEKRRDSVGRKQPASKPEAAPKPRSADLVQDKPIQYGSASLTAAEIKALDANKQAADEARRKTHDARHAVADEALDAYKVAWTEHCLPHVQTIITNERSHWYPAYNVPLANGRDNALEWMEKQIKKIEAGSCRAAAGNGGAAEPPVEAGNEPKTGNGVDPQASADAMKARMAQLNDAPDLDVRTVAGGALDRTGGADEGERAAGNGRLLAAPNYKMERISPPAPREEAPPTKTARKTTKVKARTADCKQKKAA